MQFSHNDSPQYLPPISFLVLSLQNPDSIYSKPFNQQEIALIGNNVRNTPLLLKGIQKALREISYDDFIQRLYRAEQQATQISREWHELATWLLFYGYVEDAKMLNSIPSDVRNNKLVDYSNLKQHAIELTNIAHYAFLQSKVRIEERKKLPSSIFANINSVFPSVIQYQSRVDIFDAMLKTRYSESVSDFLYACYVDSLYSHNFFDKQNINKETEIYNHSLYLLSLNLHIQAESDIIGYTQNVEYREARLSDFLKDFKDLLPCLKDIHDKYYQVDGLNTLHLKIERLLDSNIPSSELKDMMELPYEWIEKIISDR